MKEQTIKQQLANAMRRMKAKGDSESQKSYSKTLKPTSETSLKNRWTIKLSNKAKAAPQQKPKP